MNYIFPCRGSKLRGEFVNKILARFTLYFLALMKTVLLKVHALRLSSCTTSLPFWHKNEGALFVVPFTGSSLKE